MLKAEKKNRVLRIPDERKQDYITLGYTIKTMDGEVLSEPVDKDKTIASLTKELEALKAENEALKAAGQGAADEAGEETVGQDAKADTKKSGEKKPTKGVKQAES